MLNVNRGQFVRELKKFPFVRAYPWQAPLRTIL